VRRMVTLITFKRRVDAVVMLFRRIVDLDHFYREVYCELQPSDTSTLRHRLGESLSRLLEEYEPASPGSSVAPQSPGFGSENVTVFLTEQPGDDVGEQPLGIVPEADGGEDDSGVATAAEAADVGAEDAAEGVNVSGQQPAMA
jgi:hypothetical protein